MSVSVFSFLVNLFTRSSTSLSLGPVSSYCFPVCVGQWANIYFYFFFLSPPSFFSLFINLLICSCTIVFRSHVYTFITQFVGLFSLFLRFVCFSLGSSFLCVCRCFHQCILPASHRRLLNSQALREHLTVLQSVWQMQRIIFIEGAFW